MWASQRGFEVRLDWGPAGAERLAGEAGTVVVVDVLSFCTFVDVALTAGCAGVLPLPWGDQGAAERAAATGRVVAGPRGRSPVSLSPTGVAGLPPGTGLAVASPNGAATVLAASGRCRRVAAACLRNAPAVAAWAGERPPVVVLPAGERWSDDSLRPAVEDLLGAGAVVVGLGQPASPEAAAAAAAWRAAAAAPGEWLAGCASGRELTDRGDAPDVALAAAYGVSSSVPVLRNGVLEPATRDQQGA